MTMSMTEILAGTTTQVKAAWSLLTSPLWMTALSALSLALLGGLLVWLYIRRTRQSACFFFETPDHLTVEMRFLTGKTFIREKAIYKIPKESFMYRDGIYGNKPAYFYLDGEFIPVKITKEGASLDISAEEQKKIMDGELVKTLATPQNDATQLFLGMALGTALMLMIFFVMAAMKKVQFK